MVSTLVVPIIVDVISSRGIRQTDQKKDLNVEEFSFNFVVLL